MKRTCLFLLVLLCAAAFCFAQRSGGASGKTVVKLGIWPEDIAPGEIAMHEGFVKKFNAKFPNITIQPANYRYATDTFVPMAEAKMVPTIFETWFSEPQKLIAGGFVKDITAELKAKGLDAKMNEAVKNLLSRNGRIYGIPRDAYVLGIMINVELFREAGLVDRNGIPLYPKTWEELAKTAQTIKQKTGSAGLCLLAKDNGGGWHFTNIAWGFGAVFMTQRGGKWTANINSPEAVAAMQYVKDLKWQYNVLTPDPTNESWATGFQAIGVGKAAMYIAAQDAVNQPTMVNGLPVNELALVPMPAGPKGRYALMGGTPYMFASNATTAEVNAALDYLEIMGRLPVVNPDTIAGMRADAKMRREQGVPIIDTFPVWTDAAFIKAQKDANAAYRNVDPRMYADYFALMTDSSYLKTEEPILAQDLYSELTKVLQAVLTNRNADVQALMDRAQQNFQRMLDVQVNR